MKVGNLLVNAAYLGSKVLTAIAVGATKVWEGVSKYIKFKDPVVESLCMKWSSDGFGLTPDDAAKVTDIGTTFQGNTEITSFDELKAFGATKIPANAFNGCTNLSSVNLTKVTSIGDTAFQNSGLTILNAPNLTGLNYNGTFSGSSLQEITSLGKITSLPSNVYNGVFQNCVNLRRVVLPKSLTSLGDASDNIIGSTFKGCTSLSDINLNHVSEIGRDTFTSCSSLPEYLNMENLVVVGAGAFALTSIKTINAPNVTTIHQSAFDLSSISGVVNFPLLSGILGSMAYRQTQITHVENLGEITQISGVLYTGAFRGCKSLIFVRIPSSVEVMGGDIFSGCSELKDVLVLPANPPELGAQAFLRCHSSLSIYVPYESVDAYKSATNWSAYADRIKPMSEYQPNNE
jgi:hypothetical protein